MSSLLAPTDRKELLDLVETSLQKILFPKIFPGERAAITDHFSKMRIDPRQLETGIKLETTPQGQTRIVIEMQFGAS